LDGPLVPAHDVRGHFSTSFVKKEKKEG